MALMITDECINCDVCEPECPINAIYAEDDLPEDMKQFVEINAQLAMEWPVINEVKPGLPDAKQWEFVPNKLQHLKR